MEIKQALDPLTAESGDKKRKGEGAYVGVKAGASTEQSYRIEIEGAPFEIIPRDGDAIFGFEIGNQWRHKTLPIDYALEFEGTFWSGEMNGTRSPSATPPEGSNVTDYSTDIFGATFMVNGQLGLNFRQFAPRIGKPISRIHPYIGGGIGGTQLWFRDTTLTTANPDVNPTATIFASDAFVGTYQYYAGFEYFFNDDVSLYFEHRVVRLEDFDDEVSDYKTKSNVGGLRIILDNENQE
ncbi:MAG: hypothetical protein AAGD22_06120 [Verrucomicrobiota bacterium]